MFAQKYSEMRLLLLSLLAKIKRRHEGSVLVKSTGWLQSERAVEKTAKEKRREGRLRRQNVSWKKCSVGCPGQKFEARVNSQAFVWSRLEM